MRITQTVDIPASHRLTIDVPREVPAGPALLVFTPAEPSPGNVSRVIGEAARTVTDGDARPGRKPLSAYIGSCPGFLGEDPVAWQRKLRDEWND